MHTMLLFEKMLNIILEQQISFYISNHIIMKQSEVYGYNFPLNWDGDTPIEKIKEALIRQIGYEITVFEPYENDVEKLADVD